MSEHSKSPEQKPSPSKDAGTRAQKATKKVFHNHHAANVEQCPPGMKRIFRCVDKAGILSTAKGDKSCKTCEGYWQSANMLRAHMKAAKHGLLPVSERDGTFIPVDDFVTFPKLDNGDPAWTEAAADATFAAAKAVAAAAAAAAAAASAAAKATAAAAAAAMKASAAGSSRSKAKGNGIIHVNVGAGAPAKTGPPSTTSSIAAAAASASKRDSSRISSRKQAKGAKGGKVGKAVNIATFGVAVAAKRGNGAKSEKAAGKLAELVVKAALPATNNWPTPIELLPAGEPVVVIYLNGVCVSQVRKIDTNGQKPPKCGDVMPLLFTCETCRERGKDFDKLLNTSNKFRNHLRCYHSKIVPPNWYAVLCRRWETMRPGQLRSKIYLMPVNVASTLAGSGSVSSLPLTQASAASGGRPLKALGNASSRQPIAAVDAQPCIPAKVGDGGPKVEQQQQQQQPQPTPKHQPLAAWLAEQPRWAKVLAAAKTRTVEQMYPDNLEPQSTTEPGTELYVTDAGMARYDRWCVELQKHRLIWIGPLPEEVADEPHLAEADSDSGPEPACPQICRQTLEDAVTCGCVLGKDRTEQIHHVYVTDSAFDDHVFTREQAVAKVNARKQAKSEVAKLTKLTSPLSSPIRTSASGLSATSPSPSPSPSPSHALNPTLHRLPFPAAAAAEPSVLAVAGQEVPAADDDCILQHEGDAGDQPVHDTGNPVASAALETHKVTAPPMAAAVDSVTVASVAANASATTIVLPGAQSDGASWAASPAVVTAEAPASATRPHTPPPAPTPIIAGAAAPAEPTLEPTRESTAQSVGGQVAADLVKGNLAALPTGGNPGVGKLASVAAIEPALEPTASTPPAAGAATAPVVQAIKLAAPPDIVQTPTTTSHAQFDRVARIAQVTPVASVQASAAPPRAVTAVNAVPTETLPATQPTNVFGAPKQPAMAAGNTAAVSPGEPAKAAPVAVVTEARSDGDRGDRGDGGGGAPAAGNPVPAAVSLSVMTPGGQERPQVSAVPSTKKTSPKTSPIAPQRVRAVPAKRGHGSVDAGRDAKRAREAVSPQEKSGATASAATPVDFIDTAAMQASTQVNAVVAPQAGIGAQGEHLMPHAHHHMMHPVLSQHAVAYTPNAMHAMQSPVVYNLPATYQPRTTQAGVPAAVVQTATPGTFAPVLFINPQQKIGQQIEQQIPTGASQGMPFPEHTGYIPQSQPRN